LFRLHLRSGFVHKEANRPATLDERTIDLFQVTCRCRGGLRTDQMESFV
jgi:hypothetical protein